MNFYKSILLPFFMVIFFSGCESEYVEVDSDLLQHKLNDSANHTAVSWWYFGEKDNYYYLLEQWPLKSNYYKINKEYILIKGHQLTYPTNEKVNLKRKYIKFVDDKNNGL